MNRGCLGQLGRLVARACLLCGSLIVSVLLSAAQFLFFSVLGPLVAGGLRELFQAAAGVPREGDQTEGRLIAGNAATYAVLSGLSWILVAGLVTVLRSPASLYSLLWLSGAQRAVLLLTTSLIFAVGAGVGLLVHRYQRGIRAE